VILVLKMTLMNTSNWGQRQKWLSERWSYHSISSLKWRSFSTAESCLTPKFPSSFPDRSRCLRCEGFDVRDEARAIQSLSM